ncbi:hypothetical protein [Agarivorans sp. QJM3NY_25]|uniref:hypothetical protein n=1 Tax=Agarivorans sp. QJM3NY_25 TaxID=3421430 RepID=UPI003D7C660F
MPALLAPLLGGLKFFVTKLLFSSLLEVGKAMLLKIRWKVVLERFLTRCTVAGLKWLKTLDTNGLTHDALDQIFNDLQAKGLPEAKH